VDLIAELLAHHGDGCLAGAKAFRRAVREMFFSVFDFRR